jgi:hypothetical protein
MREGAVNPPDSSGGYTDSFAVKMRVQGEDFLRNLSGAIEFSVVQFFDVVNGWLPKPWERGKTTKAPLSGQ